MPLTGLEISRLADVIFQEWDVNKLNTFASDLDENLGAVAPDGDVKQRAVKLIAHLNSASPRPRDREFLEQLRLVPNGRLRKAAEDLLIPSYLSLTGEPEDAILLGRTAFVDREPLRTKVREFTNPNPNTTRLLVVRGDGNSFGRSYTWFFLRHLATVTVGATPLRLRLEGTNYTPRQLVEKVFALLLLDTAKLPPQLDNPQLAKIDPLINVFEGLLVRLERPYWLVIDDLDGPVQLEVLETVLAIASSVEELRPDKLWIALLGYKDEITSRELDYRAEDNAQFPDAGLLAQHLKDVASSSPQLLDDVNAAAYARDLMGKCGGRTREGMIQLTRDVEVLGEKLRQGERPLNTHLLAEHFKEAAASGGSTLGNADAAAYADRLMSRGRTTEELIQLTRDIAELAEKLKRGERPQSAEG